jgi:hypothetical protein
VTVVALSSLPRSILQEGVTQGGAVGKCYTQEVVKMKGRLQVDLPKLGSRPRIGGYDFQPSVSDSARPWAVWSVHSRYGCILDKAENLV